jgi:hypothetical protein
MRKYYNFDTRFISLKNALSDFLKNNNIYYELSGNYSYYHFEILADKIELEKINNFIDSQIVTEVTA